MRIRHLFVGIDVSKDTLDVSSSFDGGRFRSERFANDEGGFDQIHRWLCKQCEPELWRIGLEATSAYHRLLVRHFEHRESLILVLNPKQARDLARGLGILRKSDATDARVLWKWPGQKFAIVPRTRGPRVVRTVCPG